MFSNRRVSASLPRYLLLAFTLALFFALIGCAGGGGGNGASGVVNAGNTGNSTAPPLIANLAYSTNPIPQNSNGTVSVNGSITFTDNGGGLATLNVIVFDANGQQVSAVSTPISGVSGQTSGTLSATFVVSVNGVGVFTFQLWVTDANGSTSNQLTGTIQVTYPVPSLRSISPAAIPINSPDTVVAIAGSGILASSTMQVNGGSPISLNSAIPKSGIFFFTIPAAYLTALGQLSITVSNPGTAASNALLVNVTPNPVPTVSFLSPGGAALGGSDFTLTVSGSNFVPMSVVQWNGSARPTTFVPPGQLKATISAQDIQALGNSSISVVNPAPGGGTSGAVLFTTFISLPTNDLAYSPFTQLLYAAVPSSGGASVGNSIVPIDPNTGILGTPIFVGSEPTKMAMSSDGKVIWVALKGAGAVRKVDVVAQTAGLQFGLGGGSGMYNPPNTTQALAVMPGFPNTVAVATPGAVTVYDSGVARANVQTGGFSCCSSVNGLAFDPTGTTLYEAGYGYGKATVDSSGIAPPTSLNGNIFSNGLRVDNGRAYLTNGAVLNADTGNLLGTFFAAPNQNANGVPAPDSTIGKSFVLLNPGSTLQVNAYDISTFLQTGSPLLAASGNTGIPFGTGGSPSLVLWGQDGLAFSNGAQVYIFHSPLVRDLSGSPADVSVTAQNTPAATTTGSNLTYSLTVNNAGPQGATPATLVDDIPSGSAFQNVTSSQGSCSGGAIVHCDLGNLNAGSSATVQITVTLLTPGTLTNTATVSAPQGDPNTANNTAVSTTTVTGPVYNPMPVISSISPTFVQAGSASFTLTVNGSGFNSGSMVQLNSTPLSTNIVSANQLTANVPGSDIASMGWAWINVANPSPGGGTSLGLPLTTYQTISLDVDHFLYDPFTRKLYATVPSTATQVAGNSLVAIDPTTGSLGTPLNIGSQPNRIAESSDGQYVYIGLDGSSSVTNVDLTAMKQGPVYPIVIPSFPSPTTQVPARDLAVAPGNDNLLAIDTGSWGGNGLFDFTSGGGMRTNLTGPYTGSNLAFANGTTVYSYDSDTTGAEFNRWAVTSTGLTRLAGDSSGYTLNGIGGFAGSFKLANGIVYGLNGGVADPTTTPPTQLGQFPVAFAFGFGQTIQGTGLAPDPKIGRVFALGETLAGSLNPVLLSYDSNKYVLLSANQFTGFPEGLDLVRWGRDGIAWHSTAMGPPFGATPGNGKIIVMRGPFVLPEWSTANPTPGLTSASPASAAAGSGNLMLTITGSGFVPGAVVMWNGSERTTTFVDSADLTVAIPASDLSQSGSATLTVNNPGSGNSNSISFQIN